MPKYADPAVFPVTAPAATDNVMTRTAAGTDGNFALGNLAGLAPLAIANDQAPFFSGGAWGAYSLTAAGRALSGVAGTANTFPYFSAANVVTLGAVTATGLSVLSAASQAAARTAIQAVGTVGNESIAGAKTCTTAWRWDIGTFGSIQFANPLDQIGFIFRFGDPAGGDASMYRSDFRFSQGQMNLFVNAVAGTSAGTQGLQVTTTTVGPQVTNAMSCGSSGRLWTQIWATNAAINTSDARLKTEPRQLREAEFKAASAIARLPAVWRWLSRVHGDENCEPEGKDARKHFGPTVQAAIAVMEAIGLDPFAYSFICYDEWEALPEQWHEWPAQKAVLDDDGNEIEPAVEAGRELVQEAREAGDRYSFRKEELLCFIVRALAQEIDGLSERVAALEAGRNP
ncbi:tail fiber domain-containing protein [Stenotrophomonas bentonitica]|uniref:tail fiber domain-containing protein n=1 Tax=Stenotrophomonas bentonitica TaxID=1450134 RepID=UPI0031BABEEB